MVRKIFHFFLGFLMWMVFIYYWRIVASRPLNRSTIFSAIMIGTLVFATTVFIALWIIHNLRIHKRLKRRTSRREPMPREQVDYLCRKLVIEDEAALTRAPYIEVEIAEGEDGEEKIFHTSRQVP